MRNHRWNKTIAGTVLGIVLLITLATSQALALTKQELFTAVKNGEVVMGEVKRSKPLNLTEDDVSELAELGASEHFIQLLRDLGHVVEQADEDPNRTDANAGEPSAEPDKTGSKKMAGPGTTTKTTSSVEVEKPNTKDHKGKTTKTQKFTTTDKTGDASAEKEKPPVPITHPRIFTAETARMVPSGVIYSKAGIHTGGGLSGTTRIGLGGVSEFGIEITDEIRRRSCLDCEAEGLRYPLALFKLGVQEGQIWAWQPAIALNFRKSFTVEDEGLDTQAAELSLIVSKDLGRSVSVHAGASLWDAAMANADDERFLRDQGLGDQIRPFGGLELAPLPRARIMFELFWVPEFAFARLKDEGAVDGDAVELRPVFAWGVRHELADWALVEAGVKLPGIEDVNLIDAQIFGQVTLASRLLNRWFE